MLEVLVRPTGDLVDFHSWDDFAEALHKIVDLKPKKVILDMGLVGRMSSNYIGTIISNTKSAKEKGLGFELINVQDKLFDLLEMLKLTEVMPISKK
ncbi:MAG: STAS domain-containing protein [Pseudomonadota bacterium]